MTGATECEATSELPSPLLGRDNSVVSAGDFVFSFGGREFGSINGSADVYKYDLATNSWTQSTSLPDQKYGAKSILLNKNQIFVTGIMHFA